MLTSLVLKNFKNFRDARLNLGPFTVLVGTNASGKSNIRDALRFLHGIGRGYSLAEIIGQKWGEEGVLLWRGIRGGARETAFYGETQFSLTARFILERERKGTVTSENYTYRIAVEFPQPDRPPRVVSESLQFGKRTILFATKETQDAHNLKVSYYRGRRKGRYPPSATYVNTTPVLSQIADDPEIKTKSVRLSAQLIREELLSFRFLDLNPEAMRLPSLPGQTVLGDRGENLSSVLQAICDDGSRKKTLVEWVKELTPMDAQDFRFPSDQTGRILLTLREEGGRQTSIYSASDGTLRFLAMLAALLGPEPARHYFFEELDNGIHPTRLSLLLDLIERQVARKKVQVVTTTHSPTLLGLLNQDSLENAYLICRREGADAATILRILDLPNAARVIKDYTASRLLASGWLENAAAFTPEEAAL